MEGSKGSVSIAVKTIESDEESGAEKVDALSLFQSSPHSRAPSLPREMPEAAPQEAAASSEREPDTARASSGDGASTSNSSSTFTISPVGATAAGVAVAAAACALAAGGHWRATASALAEEGIDAVTRRKALPTAVRSSLSSVFCLSFCFLGRTRFGSYLFLFPTHSPPLKPELAFFDPTQKKTRPAPWASPQWPASPRPRSSGGPRAPSASCRS